MLETPFWRNAANSLRPHVRERYAAYLEAAERWELVVDAAIEARARARAAIGRILRRRRDPANPADARNR
jgi:hypothetical protein